MQKFGQATQGEFAQKFLPEEDAAIDGPIGRATAANVVALARHKGTILAGEEVNDGCNFFGLPGASHWNERDHVGDLFRRKLIQYLGANYRGRHCIVCV